MCQRPSGSIVRTDTYDITGFREIHNAIINDYQDNSDVSYTITQRFTTLCSSAAANTDAYKDTLSYTQSRFVVRILINKPTPIKTCMDTVVTTPV